MEVGRSLEWAGGVGVDSGTVGNAGPPKGDVGGVRVHFMAGACESSIVPPRIWLRETQPELLRRGEGTRVIASSESRSRSGSWSRNNNEISVLSRGEPQATRGDCGYGTEFDRRRGVNVCPQVRRCLGNRGCAPGRTQRYGEIVSCCKGTLCLKRGVGSRRGGLGVGDGDSNQQRNCQARIPTTVSDGRPGLTTYSSWRRRSASEIS